MRSLLALTISALALSGCVTENSYNGSDKPVVENKINNIGAARTRIALALQYLNTGNNSQAKYNLERAAEFAPNLPEVHYSLAYYYQQVGENTLADKAYQKALAIKPDDPNTLNNYGVFLCGINEYDRATDQFLKAIEIPSYIRVAESYENLALCAIEFNDFDNAESYFKQAMNHSSQRTSTLISLAALFYAKSDLHKASELLKRYDDTGKVSSRALMLNYLIKNRMGKIEDAEKIATTISQTYPTSNEAYVIREQKVRLSEFEILREKYRKAKLDELQETSNGGQISVKPKIKITRKKHIARDNSTSLVTNDNKRISVAPQTQMDNASSVIASTVNPINKGNTYTSPPPSSISEKETTPTVTSSRTKTDTSAIMLALTTGHNSTNTMQKTVAATQVPKSQKQAEKTLTKPNDSIKIISFGAPKDANFNSQQTPPVIKAPIEQNDSDVVFYTATKDTNVFAESSRQNNDDIQFKSYEASEHIEPPMLNPKVPTLSIPFHVIQFGENLFSISVRYNVKLQKLLQWNGLKESDRVMNGSKIYLNDPNVYYEIKAGDTLYEIATQRRVLIDQLMRWNKLSPDIALTPGHRLLLVDPDSYTL
ncbi:type IV pilus biogenesis/stability protein PilW [Pseudoalteromonas fuliginea]|uniref:Type IV pilus biogenesis/stability protein PilW n=1 Tax=Pseudoalteromonas fuliginea TaxID=1872678 RepID=A0ABQ6RDM6_9GAMM|nr:type IV pilus biogenesis/stability protein PilW [Pseudoalteromonas fuliginea]KAA1150846.1 type IV pilus biogenesis/stability protein PilW [Pseudoalteromonas fuliginea]KAA1165519.1 type IV pilus biogenesis/stability protein PilW [Pseudoalteromonas fuliginea]